MIYQLPVSPIPNQTFSTTLDGETWQITLETRLDNIYISLESRSRGLVLSNRICLDRTYLGYGFLFVDIDGTNDPAFDMLGTRYLLEWTDDVMSQS